ncbi:uncharacterized protein NPIL_647911 [Nephila pilipes]|uniref:Lipocalin/cytosolic fatty-acid binding domain-containing protein n=1 Tax=Nephila pilipes TaxID=299642 RepID=A0A8X6T0V0_NEPPI|nr:uncharacterized protein NPIL_647911 [Nephila pilipes]
MGRTRNMLRCAFFLLFVLVHYVNCQLIIGVCREVEHIENPDMKRYSGHWYVIAQSITHPMRADSCQRITYVQERNKVLVTYYNNSEETIPYRNGTLKVEGPNKGELLLDLSHSFVIYNFRLLYADYPELAVEYTCLDGTWRATESISVVHRKPIHLTQLSDLLALNITSYLSPYWSGLRIVNQVNC